MAIDSEIEKFSKTLFKFLYYESTSIPKPDGYEEPPSLESYVVTYAVMCRQEIFGFIYKTEGKRNYKNWKESTKDFYAHLCELFLNFTDYLNPNVFDKILIICAYILEMGLISFCNNSNIYLEFPSCFALYFDTFLKEDFYAQGGWAELTLYASKYQTISGYISELLDTKGPYIEQESFMSDLMVKIRKECHFRYLLNLLSERASKHKNSSNICYKCLAYCDLTPDFSLILKINDLTAIELFLQICLNLMSPAELKGFKKKVADDLEHHHANCKVEAMPANVVSSPQFIKPCLKCYIPIDTLFGEHVNQKNSTAAETKPNFLRKAVSQEIFKRMFSDKKDHERFLKSQNGLDFCPCCLQTLSSFDQESSTNIKDGHYKSTLTEQNLERDDVNHVNKCNEDLKSNFVMASNSKGKITKENLITITPKRHDEASENPSAETLKNQILKESRSSVIVKRESDNDATNSEQLREKFLILNVKTEHLNDAST